MASILPGIDGKPIRSGRSVYGRSAQLHGGGIGGNEMYYPFIGGATIAAILIGCGYVLRDILEG